MPSTEKTEILGLNQWAATDIPKRIDFNEDNRLLDAAIGAHVADKAVHVKPEDKKQCETTYYPGNGLEKRTLTLPFAANAVIVFAGGRPPFVYDSQSGKSKYYFGCAETNVIGDGLRIEGTTLTVEQQYVAEHSNRSSLACLNEADVLYAVLCFRHSQDDD